MALFYEDIKAAFYDPDNHAGVVVYLESKCCESELLRIHFDDDTGTLIANCGNCNKPIAEFFLARKNDC